MRTLPEGNSEVTVGTIGDSQPWCEQLLIVAASSGALSFACAGFLAVLFTFLSLVQTAPGIPCSSIAPREMTDYVFFQEGVNQNQMAMPYATVPSLQQGSSLGCSGVYRASPTWVARQPVSFLSMLLLSGVSVRQQKDSAKSYRYLRVLVPPHLTQEK